MITNLPTNAYWVDSSFGAAGNANSDSSEKPELHG